MTHEFEFREGSHDRGIYACVVTCNEYRLPPSIEGWHVVDIGAHIGSFSRLALNCGAASVRSYEGNAENFAILKRNVDDPRCTAKLAVVHGNAPHEHPLVVAGFPWPNTGGGGATPKEGSAVENIHSSTITGPIDFLKLDCEGSEFDILTSMDLSIVRRMALEFHEGDNPASWRKSSIPHRAESLALHLAQHGFSARIARSGDHRMGSIFAEREKS